MRCQDELSDLKSVSWKLFAPLVLICAIIFPANLSTSAMIFLAGLMLLYLEVPFKYLVVCEYPHIRVLVISLSLTVPALKKHSLEHKLGSMIINFSENKTVKSDDNFQGRKVTIVNGGIKVEDQGKVHSVMFCPYLIQIMFMLF